MITAKNAKATTVARNDLARIFYRTDTGPFKYLNSVGMDGLSQDRDISADIWSPSATEYGKFDNIGAIQGELSRITSSITGRLSRTDLSLFYALFREGCDVDIKIAIGRCANPTRDYEFDKAFILHKVRFTSYSTDPLVALTPGDRNVIGETLDLSAGLVYESVATITKLYTNASVVLPLGPIIATAFIPDNTANCAGCED
jgi:hypothetical protein